MNRDQLIKKLLDDIQCKMLPDDVTINTMTIICDTDIKFNASNIAKYVDMDPNGIIKISHGRSGDTLTNRTIVYKKKAKKLKKKKKVFFNQVSLCVMVPSKKEKPVNLKLFSNGSMQMTGCKYVENAIDAIERIFVELHKIKAIRDMKLMKVVEKPFCDKPEELNLSVIKNISVEMIVSKFTYPTKINRPLLFDLLQKEQIECKYDPELHASVDIKIECEDKKISVFIFEKGSIVITGARTCRHIYEAYNFVNEYLLKHHKTISRKNIGQNDIEKYL
jgi:TATA-box binding protein (TBP) (component of TFIID and TFIIIB)